MHAIRPGVIRQCALRLYGRANSIDGMREGNEKRIALCAYYPAIVALPNPA
jgi:hypothetical protein